MKRLHKLMEATVSSAEFLPDQQRGFSCTGKQADKCVASNRGLSPQKCYPASDLGPYDRTMPQNHLFTQRFWKTPAVQALRHAISPSRIYRRVTARHRCLPDFIIAGAGKAGTTSLWQYLAEHPAVIRSTTKEVNFFNQHFGRGVNWYRAHFPLMSALRSRGAPNVPKITGESTPSYLFNPLIPPRVAMVVPKVKIIILLRNPVDRAFSHYQLKIKRREEARTFDEAVEEEIERLTRQHEKSADDAQSYFDPAYQRVAYLAQGLYLHQVCRWQQFFPPDQMLIVESGELFQQTAEVYQRVLTFLGLPDWQLECFGNRYAGKYTERMTAETRQRLIEYFAPHNAGLFAHLGRRFAWDRAKSGPTQQALAVA